MMMKPDTGIITIIISWITSRTYCVICGELPYLLKCFESYVNDFLFTVDGDEVSRQLLHRRGQGHSYNCTALYEGRLSPKENKKPETTFKLSDIFTLIFLEDRKS